MSTSKTPVVRLKGVSELLESMNLGRFQKLENFHILKFEDHPKELGAAYVAFIDDCFEISISNNFEISIGVDGKTFKTYENHLSFIPPRKVITIEEHDIVGHNLGYMVFFTVDFLRFTPSFYSMIKRFPYYNIHHAPIYGLDPKNYEFYNNYMERIYEEFHKLNADSVEMIRSYLTLILFETKRLVLKNALQSTPQSRAEEITYQFERLLKETEQKKQKLSYYASKLNISDVYLSESVKKATGASAKHLLTEYIIYEAKYLLSETSYKLSTIAVQLGFNETPNFINFFKKNSGMTPNQYRKVMRN